MLAPVIIAALVEAAEPVVTLDVPQDTPCQLASKLATALAEQHVSIAPNAPRLQIRAGPSGVEVALIAYDDVVLGARSLHPGPDDCPLIANAIAALVHAWLADAIVAPPSRPAAAAPKPAPVPAPAPDTDLVGEDFETEKEETQPLATRPPLTADDVDLRPPPELREPTPEPNFDDVPDAVRKYDEMLKSGKRMRSLVGDPFPRSATVELLGGGALAPDDSALGQVSLGGDVSFYEPWGITVEGGLESSRSAYSLLGPLSANLSWLGMGARYALYFLGESGLHLSLGARVERISVALGGWSPDQRDVFTLAAVTALEWRQLIDRGFFFAARVFAQARMRTEVFSIQPMSNVLVIPPIGFGGSVGVGWTFF
jgi:hypothetical protein